MQFTEEPQIVTWPETHYVFVEKIGPFQNTARQAWKELHLAVSAIAESNEIIRYMSLYKIGPQIYRAGVSVSEEPKNLPEGLEYTRLPGGKYSRFVLTGSYAHLPEASGRAFQIAAEKKIQFRDDYCIENYVKDPKVTPEQDLMTEILFPTI